MSDLPKFVFTCMKEGPTVLFPDDELADTTCTRQKGHSHQHQWWSDDGTVVIRWEDEWSFAPLNVKRKERKRK